MEELHRCRVPAVLAADAELEPGPRRAAALHPDPHELADAIDVDARERVALDDPGLQVGGQERRLRIVAREAERRLREIVGAEREEVGVLGDLAARSAARGSSIIVPIEISSFPGFSSSSAMRPRRAPHAPQLFGVGDQRIMISISAASPRAARGEPAAHDARTCIA